MSKKKVLVVDDEEIIAMMIKDSLDDLGYEVEVALSGLDGLRRALQLKPDVITLDVMMPGMDGFQVLRALRADPATRNIPVIFISVTKSDYLEKGLKLGAADFFAKPIDFSKLSVRIEEITSTVNESASENKKVLIVDDDEAVRKLLKVRFKDQNVECLEASAGPEVIDMAIKHKPALILLDLILQDSDGFSVIKELKNNKETAGIPVIVFSGYIGSNMENLRPLGADKYLNKDMPIDAIAAEVKKVVDNK